MSQTKSTTMKTLQDDVDALAQLIQELNDKVDGLHTGPGATPITLHQVDGNAVFEVVLSAVAQAFIGNLGVNQLLRDQKLGPQIVDVSHCIANSIFNRLGVDEDE